MNRMADAAVAAWVGPDAVTRAEVAADLDRLRAGPLGTRLPPEGTGEARQLRRWVAQRVVLRRLLERERAALDVHDLSGDRPDHPDPALLGSAAADVLATSPAARVVFGAITADVSVHEDQIRDYYLRNPDRFRRPARWTLRHAFDPTDPAQLPTRLAAATPVSVTPDSLPAPVRAAVTAAVRATGHPPIATGPIRTALGWHLLTIEEIQAPAVLPFPDARPQIAAHLLDRARQHTFARWLDGRSATLVRLTPGYEHPADPRQADATHRH